MSPCRHSGERIDPIRARPVPFCFQSFLPEPETSQRRLGLVRSGALPGAVMLHRFPEQIFVDRAEDLIGEIDRPDLLAAQIVNINRCHIFLV